MGISIKHDEIERMIRQLAHQQGTGITQAVGSAVRHELERLGKIPMSDAEIERRRAVIRAVQAEVAKSTIDWSLTDDEILGFDELGVPEQPWLDDRR